MPVTFAALAHDVRSGRQDMVTDADSFVLDAPGKIYVYDGSNSSILILK